MAAKKSKAPKSNKVSKETVKEPVKEPVVVEEVVVEPVVSTTEVSLEDEVDTFMVYSELSDIKTRLKVLMTITRELSAYITSVEKQITKDKRVVDKKMKKKKQKLNSDGTKPLNGFSKPGQISDKLRKFMGLDSEQLVARVEVTKFITKYCQEKGLQNEKDKRILLPDSALQDLLNVGTDVELTYFNLQKYLKFHFPNKDGEFMKQ
jgi:chromatin remodeling complex protein RSC6